MSHLIDIVDSQMLDKADVDSLGSAPMHNTSAMNPVKINKELS